MATELTRLTHKIAIQLYLVAESCTISSSRSRRPVRKLLATPLYVYVPAHCGRCAAADSDVDCDYLSQSVKRFIYVCDVTKYRPRAKPGCLNYEAGGGGV
jgi:hypothetical protein